ncbi:response regulator transcription factor [Plasticicumulans sp.]|uniref:response regulator transcription factor n=1 Tax=Plasticicumulans sp. TaxID=2307179 RepID=UPI002C8B7437|nr:response regulator transcription factor [Plasticicumulans sp.]HND98853.1 response regulator transcription factor [Plasticicumulans sp.]HNM43869.1 response regulator transcription factor [Plasticicumulans sp.]
MRVALLEDDRPQAEMMRTWLVEAGHDVQVFVQGKALVRELGRDSYDLVVLDWMLPDIDGIQVLKWIREHVDWPMPVLFVTGKDEEDDIVQALDNGADDYMVKPVKRMEMLARLKAVSRRAIAQDEGQKILEFGVYTVDLTTRAVLLNGQPIELTQKEFDLTVLLFRGAGRVLSRGHILESVWGRSPDLNTRTVDTHVSRIRNKLDLRPEHGWQLKAVYQHGYRLEPVEVPAT